jgi:hypothetical protein
MTAAEVIRLHGRFHARPGTPPSAPAVGLPDAVARTRYRRLSAASGSGRAGPRPRRAARRRDPRRADRRDGRRGPGVDPELLASLRDDGVAMLLTSHDLADVERLADRIAIIDRGRLVRRAARTS